MFDRYTEPARRAIFFARYEASQFGADCIEPEHLLLGILRVDSDIAERLKLSGVTEASTRERMIRPGREKVSTSVDMPVSLRLKRVLAFGVEEAELAGSNPIRPEHLLLGLVREESSPAANILIEAGLTASVLRGSANSAPSDKGRRDVQQVMRILASVVPPGENAWVASLAAWIARSSGADIEALIAAIRRC